MSGDLLSMRFEQISSPLWRVRSSSDKPGNSARSVVPVNENVVPEVEAR